MNTARIAVLLNQNAILMSSAFNVGAHGFTVHLFMHDAPVQISFFVSSSFYFSSTHSQHAHMYTHIHTQLHFEIFGMTVLYIHL